MTSATAFASNGFNSKGISRATRVDLGPIASRERERKRSSQSSTAIANASPSATLIKITEFAGGPNTSTPSAVMRAAARLRGK